MASPLPEPSPAPFNDIHHFLSSHDDDEDDGEDADTASQRSISLSSPTSSPRHSALNHISHHHRDSDNSSFLKRESHPYTTDTDIGSDADGSSMFNHRQGTPDSSVHEEPKESDQFMPPTVYPPSMTSKDDRASISSLASGSSRKTRPESLLVPLPDGPIILGIALVDFNHLVRRNIRSSLFGL